MRQTFAVFSGGGVKAAAFVGAIKEAANHVKFSGVGGTSAGAIVAALLACGYSPDELENELFAAPYGDFFKVRNWRFMWNQRCGLCNSAALLKWLSASIRKKVKPQGLSDVTFRDLTNQGAQFPLKIVVTNLTTQDIKIYSTNDTPNDEVAQAVLASCSFPFVFPSVTHGTHDLVDGGVMSNFPMWLFDDERKKQIDAIPVLGFSLTTRNDDAGERQKSPSYLYSVFDSIMVAQDRVQEKYLDVGRLADVIRINIPPTATFDRKQTTTDRELLITAGRLAAIDYFRNAPSQIQERVLSYNKNEINEVKRQLAEGNSISALSSIARQHILRGGVAKDEGISEGRTYVRYYIDLMEAATNREKVEVLSQIILTKMPLQYDRIVGIKKGNILLAAHTAYRANKPLTLIKADYSFKMGYPFDGEICRSEQVVLVDDIASDASMLLHAIRQLGTYHVQVINVVALIERKEGDARLKLAEANCQLRSVCMAGDVDIQNLIEENCPFPIGD